jgi:hypothetical protein
MEISTGWSTKENSKQAIEQAFEELKLGLGGLPDFLILYTSVDYDTRIIVDYLQEVAPNVPMQGSTSCLGVMTAEGFHSKDGRGLGLFGIRDVHGDYGVGAVPVEGDPRAAGARAIESAIAVAGRHGEIPHLIWISGVPGHEESVLLGIKDVVGPGVPVTGGSSADNTVQGYWQQFANGEIYKDAVVVGALYPSTSTFHSFYSGYSPTSIGGKITKAQGRTLQEIDGQPAAIVYNVWTNGSIAAKLAGGNVLSDTTLFPIGRQVGTLGDVLPLFRLAHPDSVTEEGGLTLFADIEEGEDLVLMSGTRSSLVTRAGRVAQSALSAGQLTSDDIAGALVIYCAGCMLTVQDEMNGVVGELAAALGDKPFLGAYTFGEQGCLANGENHHGNLMISVVVFVKGADDE